jgi:outer membrane biosynthesis protein TonB
MRKALLVVPAIVLAMLSMLSGACASASAKGRSKDAPAMNVPPPPPRIIDPGPEPLPEPVSDLPPVAPPPNPAPPRPGRTPSKPPEAKPSEPKPVEQPPTETPPPVAPPTGQPPAQLRTPQTADTSNAAKAVRTTIDRASSLLSSVNYGPLSDVRKRAYDDAKRFIQQAEEALKQGNLVFAQGVATKAETLARELAGR